MFDALGKGEPGIEVSIIRSVMIIEGASASRAAAASDGP
jgi:hypothetical protein